MSGKPFRFAQGVDYPSIVAASEKVAWTVEGIFRDRCFDASKPMIPASWVGTEDLGFLGEDDQRTLNHIRAFSYPHLFGNYEEFLPVTLHEVAQQSWHDERSRLRALVRFGEEEMKHQQLFLRAEAALEAACHHTFGRYFDREKRRVGEFTDAVIQFPLLPRFLLIVAFEWGSQRHYVESVRDREGDRSDPLYVDMVKYHWIEENQHIKTDVLEIWRMASTMSPDAIVEAFDQLLGVAALIDETFVGQVEEELTTFESVTERRLSELERTSLRDCLLATIRAIWMDVGLTHPSFQKLVLELSQDGAAKLGIAAH